MTKCKSFQIIFNEADGQTYSATFDAVIPLGCTGKFVDVKGNLHHMDKWTRELHSQSTLTNVIHSARVRNTCDPLAQCDLGAPEPFNFCPKTGCYCPGKDDGLSSCQPEDPCLAFDCNKCPAEGISNNGCSCGADGLCKSR